MSGGTSRLRVSILVLGAACLLGCALIAIHAPEQAARSYLAAYFFFLAPALGGVALLMIHALTGGEWGMDLRPALLAASGVLPVLAVLFLPVLLSAHGLYPWVAPSAQSPDALGPQFARQQWYLNLPFFVARAVGCFVVWMWVARGLRRRLSMPGPGVGLTRFAALGLIVYLLSVTIAAVDWVMSLTPAWHSSTFGLLIGTGQLLAAAALAIGTATRLHPVARPRDLGSLLLALVLAWAYLAFMDYLTAWSADLPGETVWYLPRVRTTWQWLAVMLIVCQILVPFALLLSPQFRQSRPGLRAVAGLLLFSQAIYALWIVLPGFRPHGVVLHWTDALAWLGIGGVCWAVFDLRLGATRRRELSA
ncbi:MAG TPA: hypothetical protein VFB37_15275 [Steroidobacteraceae bacterium]|nr:hypothetical protein [Steroidobacteraceae bacterium]